MSLPGIIQGYRTCAVAAPILASPATALTFPDLSVIMIPARPQYAHRLNRHMTLQLAGCSHMRLSPHSGTILVVVAHVHLRARKPGWKAAAAGPCSGRAMRRKSLRHRPFPICPGPPVIDSGTRCSGSCDEAGHNAGRRREAVLASRMERDAGLSRRRAGSGRINLPSRAARAQGATP